MAFDPRTVTTPLEHAIRRATEAWPVDVDLWPLIRQLYTDVGRLQKIQRYRDEQTQPSLLNAIDASLDGSETVQ